MELSKKYFMKIKAFLEIQIDKFGKKKLTDNGQPGLINVTQLVTKEKKRHV